MKLAVSILALALWTSAADAQMRPGRTSQRPPPMEGSQQATTPYRGSALGFDPVAALERELPSLRLDLKIGGEQAPFWESFERQVRDVAELGRTRQKHQMAAYDADKALAAATLISMWASDERARASAMETLIQKLEALQGALSEGQRKEFDRRVVLSQTEPLNAPPPSEGGRRQPQR